MSRRRLLTTGVAALALVLAAPSAALADNGQGKSGDNGKGAAKGQGHNPPGNNGTIKIDYAAPTDSGHANRPHPGCAFQLRMFNFDNDQYGSITFVGQAPTKLGTLLTQPHVLLSDDEAGGGKDVDAVYSYTAQQLGLIGKPQAKQGWHIKVSVNADQAPGGAKHKVFWLKCEAPGTTQGGTTQGGTTHGGTTQGGTTDTTSTSTSGSTAGAAAGGAATAGAAAGEAATAGAAAAAPTAVIGGGAAAQPARAGSALPFTGAALTTMMTLALAALVAGGLAVHAGRRRTAQV